MENVNHIKGAISAAMAVLTALWGWFGWLVIGWVACMLLDVLTGMAAAAKAGDWRSARAREGLWHKAGCIAAVAAAGLLDLVVGELVMVSGLALPFTYTVFLCPLVIIWYVLTEAGSIVENAGALGAPVPGWLRKAIAAFRDKVDGEMDEKEER